MLSEMMWNVSQFCSCHPNSKNERSINNPHTPHFLLSLPISTCLILTYSLFLMTTREDSGFSIRHFSSCHSFLNIVKKRAFNRSPLPSRSIAGSHTRGWKIKLKECEICNLKICILKTRTVLLWLFPAIHDFLYIYFFVKYSIFLFFLFFYI